MRFIFLIAALILFSCGKKTPPIGEEKLVEILVDVHIAEGLTNSHHALALRDSLETLYFQQILEKHKINKQSFEEAMAYLHSDPQLLESVYKRVLVEIGEMSLKIDDEEARRRDRENNHRNRN